MKTQLEQRRQQPQQNPRLHVDEGGRGTYVSPRGEQFDVAPPAMPELQPGQTITTIPDRYCLACQEPRPRVQCAMCGGTTVTMDEVDFGDDDVGVQVAPAVAPELAPPDPDGAELDGLNAEPVEAQPTVELQETAPAPRPAARLRAVEQLSATMPTRKPSPMLERMRQRAAELDAPPPVPAIVERANQARRSMVAEAIDEQQRGVEWAPLTGRRPMEQTPGRQYGNGGPRTVHRRGVQSAEDQLVSFWKDAKVDLVIWSSFAAGFAASRPEATPDDVADLADQLYVAMIERQNLNKAR